MPRVRQVLHQVSGIDVWWGGVRGPGPMTEPGYLSQLVDQLERLQLERATSTPLLSVELQLDRLQLERETSTPVLSVELQLDRLQLDRVKSRPRLLSAVLQEDRLQLERV